MSLANSETVLASAAEGLALWAGEGAAGMMSSLVAAPAWSGRRAGVEVST